MGHCWRNKAELISDVLRWTPSHRHPSVGRPTRTYQQQLCTDTGCSIEDLPEAMDDREEWRKRVREIHASGPIRWWWWWWWWLFTNDYYFFFTPWEFSTSVLADGLSPESERQQFFSSFQHSSWYSGRSEQCCSLDSLHSFSCFQVLLSFYQYFVTVQRTPITISITVTFMFHRLYLSFFLLSFDFTLWSARTAKSTILQVLFFFSSFLLLL